MAGAGWRSAMPIGPEQVNAVLQAWVGVPQLQEQLRVETARRPFHS